MIKAFILVQAEVGKAASVAEHASKLKGVVSSENVAGPYDVIIRAEGESMDDIGKMVVSQLQVIQGTTRTVTCQVVNLRD